MGDDYYAVLGLTKDSATPDAIRKAYRKLALKNHPDRVKPEDKEAATERFKKIGEAYSVLSDEQKKREYDLGGGIPGFSGGMGGGGGARSFHFAGGGADAFSTVDADEIFRMMFQGFQGAQFQGGSFGGVSFGGARVHTFSFGGGGGGGQHAGIFGDSLFGNLHGHESMMRRRRMEAEQGRRDAANIASEYMHQPSSDGANGSTFARNEAASPMRLFGVFVFLYILFNLVFG
eukprot:g1563.t1